MIYDLIEYGKWLSENNLDRFGKTTKGKDCILLVQFNNNEFELNDEFYKKESFNFNNYFENSIFHDDFLISTDQRFMIPSKSNLLGLSPFFIKLDNNFMKKGKLDNNKIKKFKKKIERSINANKKNANKKNKEFVAVLNIIYEDFNNFLKVCPLNDSKKSIFLSFFKNHSLDEISSLIIKYYNFILDNADIIISKIIAFKDSDKYIKKEKSNFYLACCFNDELDLINDLFIFYSKIFKKRKENVKNFDEGVCSFCGEKTITYPILGSYALGEYYSFNYSNKMNNARLRLCNKCNSYLRIAEDNLKNNLNAPIIIPKMKESKNYESFSKISNLDKPVFSKINEFLKDNSNNFNYDLIFYTEGKGNTYIINKYVENYQAFLVEFNKDIKLYDKDNKCNYLFGESLNFDISKDKNYINNLFDLEDIFKSFFININKDGIKYLKLYNFYEIYLKDITGDKGILNGFDSKTVSIFVKYMDSIFSFIYELNTDSLNKKMLNEILMNLLFKYQKNTNNKKSYKDSILMNLNYYFMLINEFLENNMLNKDDVKNLKDVFSKYNKDNSNKISSSDENYIFDLVDKNPSLKYYLLGQFIALIDNSKRRNNKNGEIFSNFVLNCNKNNILKLFTTEVLQKNNYYIEKMNKKGKFIFKVLEQNLDSLFNEEGDFYFEDYLLLIFTGYYTENILSSSYGSNDS
ncbi:hypothetical protein BGI41_01470 [Methanobrevibacter sp. 87.7]|uniref:hypothetical protein n=1 Tax=Methanobrevibacter sp. 87.7 TaxID=387957 RepID=UPI000B5145C8|nr:hypothetical protein [Methanobrevibacter sp. 87.7]OWT33625.1 hypothetical protein BGI41_01470 [Methanobrevibacter sp. 87.7]